MITDKTLDVIVKLAENSGTDVMGLQNGLRSLTAEELLTLQQVVMSRLSAKIQGM